MPVTATKHKKTHWVCAEPQNTALTQSEFEALTWVQVKNCRSEGDFGITTQITRESTFDNDVDLTFKGSSAGTDFSLEALTLVSDPGQEILRTFGKAANLNAMAVKIVSTDANSGEISTSRYSRGKVHSPIALGGTPNDGEAESFGIALEQEPIVVKAA
ncbi:hypothetical protein [Roseibium sp. RKSG952]|uniref:hypothetical protein n=1 Tax=Roseibium sp. RKSG952 TaxID=2529384 RepID=UPI0012BD668D|nr:hypothetical protein [Roseibium sp. RKSG952]MTH96420.1 hypothetical protein [Roseibium sp. RKSG952]